MDKQELNRRKLLSGILATGGAGGLVGRGTAAIFTDEETFTNNNIQASASTAGVVDMEIDYELGENGSIEYCATLPDDDGINNPSYIWVRTTECPPQNSDADNLRVQLSVCDDTVLTGSLREVLDYLYSGVLLACGDGNGCLQPENNEEVCLEIEVIEVIGSVSDTVSFKLEFYGQQCRYDDAATNPFDPSGPSCDPPDDAKAISFIQFCSESTGLTAKTVDTLAEDGNEPTSVVWETNQDVKYVIVKSGQGQFFTIYDYTGVTITSGIATTGGYTDAEYSGDPCNDLSEDDFVCASSPYNPQGECNINNLSSEACALAIDVLNSFEGEDYDCDGIDSSVKLEEDKGEI